MYLSLVLSLLFVGHVAVAKPDVAGTRTVVISLATGESGQIIPFVLHRNSHGFDPITISSTDSTDSVFSDTSYDWASSDSISTSVVSSEESTVISIEVSSTAELGSETSMIETNSESSVSESSVSESSAAEPSSVSSVSEQVSTTGEDLGSGSDSDSDTEESKKSIAVNSSSHTSKKSSASTYTLPSAAFITIYTCLFAATLNRQMF
ncbi:hypothetical protein GGH13_006264 [Coemansia sp. S155-1]|nr:hypothetical protein H4S03_001415 [Coemansia sp. S3946]KAJ2063677.1 hypothetical protein GGH13_006264 [Coemansia sp. S155-1]